MNTAFLLMAQYDARAVIPLDQVCADYFPHLQPAMLLRKIASGEIALPVVRRCGGFGGFTRWRCHQTPPHPCWPWRRWCGVRRGLRVRLRPRGLRAAASR